MRFEYEDRDYVLGQLRTKHRSDLKIYVPVGGANTSKNERLFWADTVARFRRGEVWDAITAIERRFRPQNGWYGPENNNAYHFVEPAN